FKIKFPPLSGDRAFSRQFRAIEATFPIKSALRSSEARQHLRVEMASQSQGIQQLLVAEKRAAEKVAEARKRKARRIKQARDEAASEIEQYRKERERQFREYETKYMGSKEDAIAKIDKQTESLLQDLDQSVQQNQEGVILDLISLVIDVEPEVHRNYFIMKKFNKI
ncbi:unnamed protein product, partial [Phyllotreta striolata]